MNNDAKITLTVTTGIVTFLVTALLCGNAQCARKTAYCAKVMTDPTVSAETKAGLANGACRPD